MKIRSPFVPHRTDSADPRVPYSAVSAAFPDLTFNLSDSQANCKAFFALN
jgi:hypothetical protein